MAKYKVDESVVRQIKDLLKSYGYTHPSVLDFEKNEVSANFSRPGLNTITRLKIDEIPTLTQEEICTVRKLIAKLSGKVDLEQVILFGSRARGDFREDSDLDLMLVGKGMEASPFRRIVSDTLFEVLLDDDSVQHISAVTSLLSEWDDGELSSLQHNIVREGIILDV
ncbi:nucleotidyltransferase domain-containing protein [Paenibacillus jiagnxiensis]|uniref:nucleotidyltransferase domain-containing protein n=1 Tax=Paenibacillus jiagnxiensis TaxID=3228926 RepID=UPI0033A38AEC